MPPSSNKPVFNALASPITETPPTPKRTDPANHPIKGLNLAILFSSLTLVSFLSMLDTSIIGTAIPHITSDFHALADIGWYVSAYTLGAATLQPLSGKLYTFFSTKLVFLSFVFMFEAGSLICGVASSSAVFIVGRAVAGLGVSGILNGALTVIAASVEKSRSPMYTGFFFAVAQMGVVVGPLVGGGLTQLVSWRWCFYLNLPAGGVAALILTFIHFPEVVKKEPVSFALLRKVAPELDLFGFVLFVPPSILFILALQFGSGNTYAWDSATVVGCLVGSGVLFVLFILWEWKMGDRAMIPGNLFKKRVVSVSYAFGICNAICMLVASNFLPTFFQAVKGDGPSLSGVHLLPSILGQLLFTMSTGALVSKLGYYLPWAFGGSVILTIGNGLVSTFSSTTSVGKWVGYQIVMGVGRGVILQLPLIAVQNAVAPPQIPIAMAVLVFIQNFGVSIGITISNAVFAQTLIKAVRRYAPSISPQAVLDAGSIAGAVRDLAIGHEGELDGILRAYSEGLSNVFYLLVGFSCAAVVLSLGMGWVDVRKKKETGKPTEDPQVKAEKMEG
ncbi:efflux pump protein [Decorospora gaudefroyi]|uniref:Efflux pump protein n=1 Tax=Decorospora gaudefroyi TaxID=184978 RepID=A0A6A5KAJ4_9PLEO|nr:efflux pump protein [Decorospora gaudefroyi]